MDEQQGIELSSTRVQFVKQKYHDRFQHMVDIFSSRASTWEENLRDRGGIPSRLELIILGCFVGSKTPGVVTALRILYEDYIPLRVAGDLIFKLVEKSILSS